MIYSSDNRHASLWFGGCDRCGASMWRTEEPAVCDSCQEVPPQRPKGKKIDADSNLLAAGPKTATPGPA